MKKTLRINTSILALLTLQLCASTPSSAIYKLDDIDPERYQTNYNKLSTVENSDHQLQERSAQFSQLLEDAEKIVNKYEMEGHVGFRLIHNHFLVGKGQLMVEESQSIKETPSLVTSAQDFDAVKTKKAVPASWIVSENPEESPIAFEMTTDPAARAGRKLLKKNPEFMKEMSDLLKDTKFNSLLSVALLKKDSIVAAEDEMYMEISEANPQRSIVQILKADQITKPTIRTSWSFKGPKQQACDSYIHCYPDGYSHNPQRAHIHIPSY